MASISQAQASLGSDFTAGGIAKGGEIKLNAVEAVMSQAALEFIKLAKKRLTQRGKIDTGNLSDIVVSQLTNKGGTYEITIGYLKSNPASKYYDYNNKGVKGIGDFKGRLPRGFKKPTNTPYEFKDIKLSNDFIESIINWYLRHRNYIKNEDQRKNLSGIQKKRNTISSIAGNRKNLRFLAINTAKNIKRKGISRTGFFEDNIDEAFGEGFKIALSKALGQDVSLIIKQTVN